MNNNDKIPFDQVISKIKNDVQADLQLSCVKIHLITELYARSNIDVGIQYKNIPFFKISCYMIERCMKAEQEEREEEI